MSSNTLSRKQEICITAARLFKQKGYSAVTMRDLAAAIGVKAASLYNHIASKEEILNEVILTIAQQFTEGINEIRFRESAPTPNEPSHIATKLEAVIAQHVNLTADNPFGMAALNNDWMHLGEGKVQYLKLRNEYEQHFREMIKEGKTKGVLKDIDLEVILFSTLGTLRNLYLWIPKKAELDRAKLIQSLSETLLKGIKR
jgi:AcrR family transcriptional regulator